MTQKIIEYVCTGNNGRSPIARAIAKARLLELAVNDYDSISSGTLVDSILAGNMATPLKKTALIGGIEQGAEGKIYNTTEAKDAILIVREIKNMSNEEFEARYAGDSDFRTKFNQYAELSRQYFAVQENMHCVDVAREMGIEAHLDGNFKQTVSRLDVMAVLPMAKGNLDQARKIYTGQEPKIMEVITEYALGHGAMEIPNTFGKPAEAYFEMVQTLKPVVIATIDKVIAEYK